jgi:hypothetical protein
MGFFACFMAFVLSHYMLKWIALTGGRNLGLAGDRFLGETCRRFGKRVLKDSDLVTLQKCGTRR